MPTFKITGPDNKVYRVSGDNAEGALEALKKHIGAQPEPDKRDNIVGKADAFARGVADTATFGLSDEIAAHAKSGPLSVPAKPDEYYERGIYAGKYNPLGMIARAIDAPFASETKNADYEKALAEERAVDQSDYDNRFGYRLAGQLTGGVGTGATLAKAGLSPTANAITAGRGLGRVAGVSAGEGLALGAAQGFGSGEGVNDRLAKALIGGSSGLVLGGLTPLAVAGVSKVAKGAAAPVLARLYPENYAEDAVTTAMRRADRTPQQVADVMDYAAREGQPEYNVADALGYTGQRLASVVARNPHNERQPFVESLQRRQMGQGDRLARALVEGFDAPQTADAVATGLKASRTNEANKLYGAARNQATPVNVTPVLETIDKTLSPGINSMVNPRDRIANDSIEGALSRVRSMLSDGNSQITDFDALFRVKLDLDDMITAAEGRGANNRAFALNEVKRAIDSALEEGSPAYRAANDTFRQRSEVIDAVPVGSAATSGRQRADDTIAAFNQMTPDQQQAFRAGYVDPIIAKVESTPMGPLTNRARALTTPKYEQEFPAFAAPGRGPELGRRIGREQRMYETANAALGNSKTADNLADAADFNQFDPGVISAIVRRDIPGALMAGATRAINEFQGMPPSVIERIARTLMETDPNAARDLLTTGTRRLSRADQARARVVAALLASQTAAPGRVAP
ncbi:hypothetical protein [Rhizobium sp. BK251]|uniref:hypothetical protein n=1 Tax=Rhizobium sp. BK251 TaxID=2512125 RepID=UPI001051FDEA|nr:hypothetical protein [Rhizobium sp. BK251]TCL70532.1 hypothetical protein EV286_107407 [Rhizobium sp. BK251]